MSNEDDRSDEIMALQSIYGEDIFSCNIHERHYRGVVKIHVETGLEVHDFICSGYLIPLNHLSPVVLNFSLPPNYPFECPPDVSLSCLWLTSQQLEDLSNILKDYWKESCSVVLFSWMDLIKTELFKLLEVKFPVEISEENIMKLTEINLLREEQNFKNGFYACPICFLEFHGSECVRLSNCGHVFCKECLAGFLSVCISDGNVKFLICPAEECEDEIYQHVIKNVISEVEYEKYERLLLHKTLSIMQDIQYCPRYNCGKPVIVEDDDLGFCHCCNFAFCIKCNSTYHGVELCKKKEILISGQRTKPIKAGLEQELEKARLAHEKRNAEVYARYLRNKDKKRKEKQEQTAELIIEEYHNMLFGRRVEYHAPAYVFHDPEMVERMRQERQIRLQQAEMHRQERERQVLKRLIEKKAPTQQDKENEEFVNSFLNAGDEAKEEMISVHGRGKIDDAVSENWISKNSQKCPKCSSNLEKMSGCNKMVCGVCRTPFCWLCLEILKQRNPYEHFSNPKSQCYNLLT